MVPTAYYNYSLKRPLQIHHIIVIYIYNIILLYKKLKAQNVHGGKITDHSIGKLTNMEMRNNRPEPASRKITEACIF